MRNLVRSLLLFAICLSSTPVPSCATTSNGVTAVVATVKDCADKTTHAVAEGIVDDISGVLVCDATNASTLPACVVTQLEKIAKTNGWAAVDCALQEIQAKAGKNVALSSDPTEAVRWRRASAATAARTTGKLGPAS